MQHRGIIAACSEIHTKHKLVVSIVTTWKFKPYNRNILTSDVFTDHYKKLRWNAVAKLEHKFIRSQFP